MATTMSAINLNYNRAKAQASRLDEIAQQLRKLGKSGIEQGCDELLAGWQGENAQLFVQKERELGSDIIKTAKEIEEIAQAVRSAARKIYEADKRAAALAAATGYSGGGGGFSSGGGGGGSYGGGGGRGD